MDEDGWVHVTGRIKEQYKLENGKYVVPTPVENAIGMSRFISQVVLVGANKPHNVALIVPEWSAIRSELDYDSETPEETLVNDEGFRALIDDEIQQSCAKLRKFEVPKSWAVVSPFTVGNNMLTPKMSIRKPQVLEVYKNVIAQLYGDDSAFSQAADNACAYKEVA
jgi:long-chain acyl-CoA synthetase